MKQSKTDYKRLWRNEKEEVIKLSREKVALLQVIAGQSDLLTKMVNGEVSKDVLDMLNKDTVEKLKVLEK